MKSLIRLFSSVKLAIVLLIIITLASVLGTLIPQMRGAEEYAARYGQLSGLMMRLQLTNLYHSWWFISLLFLFALNIVVCTLTRLGPKLRRVFRPRMVFDQKSLSTLKISQRFTKPVSSSTVRDELVGRLRARHYRVREAGEEDKTFVLGRKRSLGLFGSDIVHLGLLVILTGAILSGFGGFRTAMTLSEGETAAVPEADFELRLDKFETEYYPDGGVKDWKSTLTVVEQDRDVLTRTIEVNHPLTHGGFVFYQSSYGWDWKNASLSLQLRKTTDPEFIRSLRMRVGQKVEIDGEGLQLAVQDFVPDFVIGENGQVATRSLDPNNPAALVEGSRNGQPLFSGWVFAEFPDFGRLHGQEESEWTVEFKEVLSAQYSGIQVARDPGVPLIWAGCAILMLGLMVAFFWPAREIRVVVEGVGNRSEITAGGIAEKGKEEFRPEFDQIIEAVRRSK